MNATTKLPELELSNLGLVELDERQLVETDGGLGPLAILLIRGAVVFLAGVAAGYAAKEALE